VLQINIDKILDYIIMKYLEKYKYIFGKPKKGAHQYRFLDTAIVDYLLTIIGAIIITYFSGIPLVLTTIFLFILGIVLHILFGLPTNTTRYLGIH
tara:strand:- start:1554 stop:1838 length:285 start_codon:yes stop_codon:yes gene_type:complete